MKAIVILVWLTAFLGFTWGVLRFFRRPASLTRQAHLTAALGAVFSVCDFVAVVRSTMGTLVLNAASTLLLAAISLFWWSVHTCRSRPLTAIGQNDQPAHLLQAGPYGAVRHPFYASYTLFWIAGWVASGSTIAMIGAATMLCVYVTAARCEEHKFGRSPLASEYAQYRRRTGMLVPRLRLGPAGSAIYCPVVPRRRLRS
jgi:protein-S-isoprenylcysteine O-methyltransferase Ste14